MEGKVGPGYVIARPREPVEDPFIAAQRLIPLGGILEEPEVYQISLTFSR
jgi:hypothetical protein